MDGPTQLGSDGEFTPYTDNAKTDGNWKDEESACRDFDAAVVRSELFGKVHREVWGHYQLSKYRLGFEHKRPRIDRVLIPNENAFRIGWDLGPIGVELKASGVSIGPVMSQVLDYSSAIWELPHGFWIWLRWIFVFPIEATYGPLASMMVQNCMGIANLNRGDLRLKTDQSNVLSRGPDGWKFKSPPSGNKVGSR